MATYVGNTGTTHHYADHRIGLFWNVAQHIEVRMYSRGEPHVIVTDIGRARSSDHAVDKVAAIVRRKRGYKPSRDRPHRTAETPTRKATP